MSSNYVFIIDTTKKFISSGGIKVVIDALRVIIDGNVIQNEDRAYISFITFNSFGVNFFKINQSNGTIQLLSIGGKDPFLPDSINSLLLPFEENKDNFLSLIDTFELVYSEDKIASLNEYNDDMFIRAIECGRELLSSKGGKLIVINATTTWANEFNQNNKEQNANENFYINIDTKDEMIQLGKSLSKVNITCDIFQFQIKKEEQNIRTLSRICDYSNGNLYLFNNFNMQIHYKSLFNQLIKVFSKEKAYDAFMQINTSSNLQIYKTLTPMPFSISSSQNKTVLPSIEICKTYSFQFDYIKSDIHTKSKSSEIIQNVYFQIFIVYTNIEGSRVIKVFNKQIPVHNSIDSFYKNIDIESTSVLIAKITINSIYQSNNIQNSIAEMRQLYFNRAMMNLKQKGFNELLSLLIICFLGIVKNRIFVTEPKEYKVNKDILHYTYNKILKGNVNEVMTIIIPHIYDLTNYLEGREMVENVLMSPLLCTINSIEKDKIYLIDNGNFITLHFTSGKNKTKERIEYFFGKKMNFEVVGTYFHSEASVFEDNPNKDQYEIEKCKEIIDVIRGGKNFYPEMFFSFEGTISENILKECLIQDNKCAWFKYGYSDYYKTI